MWYNTLKSFRKGGTTVDRLLTFTQNYFNNCGIQSIYLTPESNLHFPFDLKLRKQFMEDFDYQSTLQLLLNNATHILLCFTDIYHCSYYLLTLPKKGHYLLVGPFLRSKINQDNVSVLLSDTPLANQPVEQLISYYDKLPTKTDEKNAMTLLITFAHELYPDQTIFLHNTHMPTLSFAKSLDCEYIEDIAPQSRLKDHYTYMDRLTDALKRGDYSDAWIYLNKYQDKNLLMQEDLTPLSSAKKGLYIQNTIYRLACYNCGIELRYLRTISQKFSKEIDQMADPATETELAQRMLYNYCEMVNKCRLSGYSPIIQKAIAYIGKHLSDESLSLSKLAQNLNINNSYLSKLFKAEVNMTVTEYISQIRIERAMEHLKTGNMKIQDIAFAVGYTDIAYFTKCFKKRTGLPPSEFKKNWNLAGLK